MVIRNKKRKTAAVIIAWLIFVCLTGILLLREDKRVTCELAKKELLTNAEMIADQVPGILRNEFNSELALAKMQNAEVEALAYALKDKKNIGEAAGFLDDYCANAGIEGLAVYDREGKLLYISDGFGEEPTEEELAAYFSYDAAAQSMLPQIEAGILGQYYFSSDNISEGTPGDAVREDINKNIEEYSAGEEDRGGSLDNTPHMLYGQARDGEWRLIIKSTYRESEAKILDSFNWRTVIWRISEGKDGYVLAADENDGTVLLCDPADNIGKNIGDLGIRIGEGTAASFEDLKAAFEEPDKIVEITMEDGKYYAVRLDVANVLMLDLMPVPGLWSAPASVLKMWLLLILTVSGICVLYTCYHLRDREEILYRETGRFVWNRTLAGKITACAMIAGAAVFAGAVFIGLLFEYSDSYQYAGRQNENAAISYLEHDNTKEELGKWFDEAYLARCRIAGSIIRDKGAKKMNWDELAALSENLGVKYIYVFDAAGKIIATNSPYDRIEITDTDAFYPLLEGRAEMTGPMDLKGISDETLQRAGVSIRGEDHRSAGIVMIAADIVELEEIRENLGMRKLFEQLCLSEGSRIITLNAVTGLPEYMAAVRNGTYEYSEFGDDPYGASLAESFKEGKILTDGYSGTVTIDGQRYMTTVDRLDDVFFLFLRPVISVNKELLTGAGLLLTALVVLAGVTMFISCFVRRGDLYTLEEDMASSAMERGKKSEEKDGEPVIADTLFLGDAFVSFERMLNKKKPFFEERWPAETTRWRDKTNKEKFSTIFRLILGAAFAALFINAMVAGQSFFWHYILAVKWQPGLNFHSLSACLVYICLMLFIKMLLHKALFIIARAADTKGETVCRLLDSALGYILSIIGIFICLAKLGLNLTALSLTAGVAGVIFSIGCQSIVADILAGFLMAFEGTVCVGDFIFWEGKPQYVLSIGVRTTSLKFFGETTVVRNNDFKNFVLKPSDERQFVITPLLIDLDESLERVEKIFEEELPRIGEVLASMAEGEVEGPYYAGVRSITENSMLVRINLFCEGREVLMVQNALNRELKLVCERRGIMLAKPQIVVNERRERKEEDGAEPVPPEEL